MSKELRQHARTELPARVKLKHPDCGEVILKTRDLSDGGIYVLCERSQHLSIGSEVKIQVLNDDVETPIVHMTIVRHDSEGMGLEFIKF